MFCRIFDKLKIITRYNGAIYKQSQLFLSSDGKLSSFCMRTRHCGELRAEQQGEQIVLCGWLQRKRVGRFLVLRDAHGTIQVTLEEPQLQELVKKLSLESVVRVEGLVRMRPQNDSNPEMKTGDIEVIAQDLKVLNTCAPQLPVDISNISKSWEEQRLTHRYLDLRTDAMQHVLRTRSHVQLAMRNFLCNQHGFVDVETPTLFRKTPGGAREFVVPTCNKGKFYALPQSPQQFKQLLMVGGIDRYMQIARCYRDESLKSERQPEFTQVDLEMSFVTQEDIKALVEELIVYSWPEHLPPITRPFKRMSYRDAMQRYGSDKPDTRFDMQLVDVTDTMKSGGWDQVKDSASVGALNFKNAAGNLSKKDRNLLKKFLRSQNRHLNTVYYMFDTKEGGSWAKYLCKKFNLDSNTAVVDKIIKQLDVEKDDLVIISSGIGDNPCEILGRMRVNIANLLEAKDHAVREKDVFHLLWVDDFPLFLPKEDGQEGIESAHHPFTAPHEEDTHLLYQDTTDLLKIRSQHYDLVLNGSEIGGGSIRIHNSKMQRHVLENILKEDASTLEHLLKALDHGCPPHGGIALGFDRLLAIMCGKSTIRDVIAFPKSSDGRDLMSGAPSPISQADRKYYHLN